MKKTMLLMILIYSLFTIIYAIQISHETGEIIPGYIYANPAYQQNETTPAPAIRDVGSWTGSGPWGGNVRSIITDPANSMHVLAACGFNQATTVGGVFSSEDGGINWSATSLQGKPFYALAASASQPNTFYAGARNGLYKTVDNGVTWTAAGLTTTFILSIGVKANNGNIIIVGKSGGTGINVSTDGGQSFNTVGVNSGFMRLFNYSSINPNRMFVVMGTSTSSVLTSIDNGATWTSYGPAGDGWGMYCSPTDSLFSMVAHANGIYRTVDGGVNWNVVQSGTFRSIVEYNGIFYAINNESGIFESNDQGLTWVGYTPAVVQSTWQAGASSGAGALLGYWGGVFRATGFQTPVLVSHKGMNAAFVHGLAYYSDTNELWAGTEGSGIYKSTDNGATWEQSSEGLGNWMVYEFAPTNHQYYQSGRMLAGTLNGVYTSVDNGHTWTYLTDAGSQCCALEVHPTDPNKFWVGTSSGEIKYTDNGGLTWRVATGNQFGFAPRLKLGKGPTGNLRLFLCYQGSATAVWYSDDDGATFTASTGMETTTYQPMVAVRPEIGDQPQIIYAASDLGVYKSTDDGATFVLSGLTGFSWSVLTSPGMQVISGKENGLGYSTNEAVSSSSLNQNLTNTTVWQMAWGSSTNEVFIATKGKGVFENRFSDTTYQSPNLNFMPWNHEIDFFWTNIVTPPTPISYTIWRDGYPVYLDTSNQSFWNDGGLTNGQTYHYFITAAYEGNIQTCPSQILEATPIMLLPPTNLTAIPEGNVVHLSWTAPDGLVPDGYLIYRDLVAIVPFITTTNYDDIITASGTYTYTVAAIYVDQYVPSDQVSVSIVSNHDSALPIAQTGLINLYPNPFIDALSINYHNADKQRVEIDVYNVLGQLVTTILNEELAVGTYQSSWNGTDKNGKRVPRGIYFLHLQAGNVVSTRKAILVK